MDKCNLQVNSPHVKYTEAAIETNYTYSTSTVSKDDAGIIFVSSKSAGDVPQGHFPFLLILSSVLNYYGQCDDENLCEIGGEKCEEYQWC